MEQSLISEGLDDLILIDDSPRLVEQVLRDSKKSINHKLYCMKHRNGVVQMINGGNSNALQSVLQLLANCSIFMTHVLIE